MTKEKIFKILKIILIVLLAVILILLIKKIINKEEIPFITNTRAYIVLTGSMEPEINIGDVVIIKKASKEDIKVGDVVSFSKGGGTVTHRITKIEEIDGVTNYTTKGDHNNIEDAGTIQYENIEGKVKGVIPKLGHIVLFIQQNILAIVLFFIFIIVFIKTLPKKTQKEDKK